MHSGNDFFGWKPQKSGDKLAISLGETTLTFPVPKVDLEDLDARFEHRNAYQPISMEALHIQDKSLMNHKERNTQKA